MNTPALFIITSTLILSLAPLAAQIPRAGQRGYNPVKVINGHTIHDSDGDG